MNTAPKPLVEQMPRSMRMSYRTQKTIKTILYHVLVVVVGYIMIYPLLWMVGSSFKPPNEIFTDASRIFPKEFVTYNYPNGWRGFAGYGFSTFFTNSFIISTISTIGFQNKI